MERDVHGMERGDRGGWRERETNPQSCVAEGGRKDAIAGGERAPGLLTAKSAAFGTAYITKSQRGCINRMPQASAPTSMEVARASCMMLSTSLLTASMLAGGVPAPLPP